MWFVKTFVVEATDMAVADTLMVDCLSGVDNEVQVYSAQIEGEMTTARMSAAHALAGKQFKEALKLKDKKGSDD